MRVLNRLRQNKRKQDKKMMLGSKGLMAILWVLWLLGYSGLSKIHSAWELGERKAQECATINQRMGKEAVRHTLLFCGRWNNGHYGTENWKNVTDPYTGIL